MCDPTTIMSAVKIGSDIIQGNINRAGVERQEREELKGIRQAQDTLRPYEELGQDALSRIFEIEEGLDAPLIEDPTLKRELQLGTQAGSAAGLSTSPSFASELLAASLPGVSQRRLTEAQVRTNLLSPIFQTGVNASGDIARLQQSSGLVKSAGIASSIPDFSSLAGSLAELGQLTFLNQNQDQKKMIDPNATKEQSSIFNTGNNINAFA